MITEQNFSLSMFSSLAQNTSFRNQYLGSYFFTFHENSNLVIATPPVVFTEITNYSLRLHSLTIGKDIFSIRSNFRLFYREGTYMLPHFLNRQFLSIKKYFTSYLIT